MSGEFRLTTDQDRAHYAKDGILIRQDDFETIVVCRDRVIVYHEPDGDQTVATTTYINGVVEQEDWK